MAKKKEQDPNLDLEIIKELKIALSKLRIGDLKVILDSYGKKPKEEIIENLLEWNTNFVHRDEEDGDQDEDILDELMGEGKKGKKKKQFTIDWIEFEDKAFVASWINRIDREEGYNYLRHHPEYSLIINKVEFAEGNKSQVAYANTKIIYKSKKDRDEQYNLLKTKLYPFGVRFI